MAKKRKQRKNINEKDHDLLKPVDVFSLGSANDPCFGKHHDLLAKECKACGDSEFCQIAMASMLKGKDITLEKEQRTKDLEEANLLRIKKKEEAMKLIKEYRKKGIKNYKILLLVWDKTHLTKDEVKQLLNN